MADQELVSDMKLNAEICGNFTYHDTFEPDFNGGLGGKKREKWEKGKFLGQGTYGTVWLEKCVTGQGPNSQSTAKMRAVKIIVKRADPSHRSYCNQELQAIAKFSHKKYKGLFVRSLGWFETPESIFITMEYIEQGNLSAHLKAPLPEDEARHISWQLLLGLKELHENKFAHRDLKPDNIFVMRLGPRWWVKIGDFGFSKRYNQGSGLYSQVGTYLFLAPEILPGTAKSTYTYAVDMWSLGVTIFFILSHVYPFESTPAFKQNFQFPFAPLVSHSISQNGQSFLQSLLKADPSTRMTTQDAFESAWLASPALDSDYPMASQLAPRLVSKEVVPNPVSSFKSAKSSGALGGSHTWGDFSKSSFSSTMQPTQSNNRPHTNHLQSQSLRFPIRERSVLVEGQNAENGSLSNKDGDKSDEDIRQHAARDQQIIRRKRVGSLEHRRFRGIDSSDQNKPTKAENPFQDGSVKYNYDEGNSISTKNLDDLVSMGEVLVEDNKYTEAEAVYRQAFKGYRDVFGSNHEKTLKSLSSLGHALYKQKKYGEAETAHGQAFEGNRDTLGAKNEETLKSLSYLGHALYKQKKYGLAATAHRQAFEGKRETLGINHERTLSCLLPLGSALSKNEKYIEAEKVYRQALEWYRDDLGAEPERKLEALHCLGDNLYRQKKYMEAERLLRQALEGRRDTLGANHCETLRSLSCLSNALYRQKKYAEAETAYRQAFEVHRDTLGENHELTLRNLQCLGNAYYYQNRWIKAERAYRRVLRGYRDTLGATHEKTTNCLNLLGDCLNRQQRYDEADLAYQQASEDRRKGEPSLLSRIAKFGTRK
ncbi:hypothetical protein N7488_008450 [Penicillium malachiteum]|nr:hypothetical protein N7488_008450 [Penicillium malachiteum]